MIIFWESPLAYTINQSKKFATWNTLSLPSVVILNSSYVIQIEVLILSKGAYRILQDSFSFENRSWQIWSSGCEWEDYQDIWNDWRARGIRQSAGLSTIEIHFTISFSFRYSLVLLPVPAEVLMLLFFSICEPG